MIFELFTRPRKTNAPTTLTPAATIEEVARTFIKALFQPRSQDELHAKISRLEQRNSSALGIEADIKDALTAQTRALKTEAKIGLAAGDITLSVLDMSFLRQNKPYRAGALPAYAVFDAQDPCCELIARAPKPGPSKADLLQINPLYTLGDLSTLQKAADKRLAPFDDCPVKVAISTRFTYQVPEVVRSRLQRLQPIADNIYIITDAPDWRLNETVPLVAPYAIAVAKIEALFLMVGPAWTPLPIELEFSARQTDSVE